MRQNVSCTNVYKDIRASEWESGREREHLLSDPFRIFRRSSAYRYARYGQSMAWHGTAHTLTGYSFRVEKSIYN